jgi:hypothetical protein
MRIHVCFPVGRLPIRLRDSVPKPYFSPIVVVAELLSKQLCVSR